MKHIAEVRSTLKHRAEQTGLVRVPTRCLRLLDDGLVTALAETYRVGPLAQRGFAELAEIPSSFFCRCPLDLQATIFNRIAHERLEAGVLPLEVGLVVGEGRRIVALSRAHLTLLSAHDVFTAAMAMAPPLFINDQRGIEVFEVVLSGIVGITLLVPSSRITCSKDDTAVAGIDIRHDDLGGSGTQISVFILRDVCKNEVVVHSDGKVKPCLLKTKGARRRMLKGVKRIAALVWAGLDQTLGAYKQLTCARVNNTADAVDLVARCGGLTLSGVERREILLAMERDELGPGDTMFHVLNACSRVGTHDTTRPEAWRRKLLFGCGEVIQGQLDGRGVA